MQTTNAEADIIRANTAYAAAVLSPVATEPPLAEAVVACAAACVACVVCVVCEALEDADELVLPDALSESESVSVPDLVSFFCALLLSEEGSSEPLA